MGLDMFLHRRGKNIRAKILRSLRNEKEEIGEGIAYWRKDYFIHDWFCDNFDVRNCEEVALSKEDLLNLIEYLKGDEEEKIGKSRKEDIEKLTKIINETDWENEEVYYYAWW